MAKIKEKPSFLFYVINIGKQFLSILFILKCLQKNKQLTRVNDTKIQKSFISA